MEQFQNPATYFQYQNNKKKLKNKSILEKQTYFVKIPFEDPVFNHRILDYPVKLHFYLKSYKPQNFWYRNGTKIVFETV